MEPSPILSAHGGHPWWLRWEHTSAGIRPTLLRLASLSSTPLPPAQAASPSPAWEGGSALVPHRHAGTNHFTLG